MAFDNGSVDEQLDNLRNIRHDVIGLDTRHKRFSMVDLKFLYLLILIFIPSSMVLGNPLCQLDKPTPVEDFGCKVDQTFFKCRLRADLAFLEWQLGKKETDDFVNEVGECITSGISEVEPIFKKAKNELSSAKNNKGLEVLKDLYAYWLTSMDISVLGRSANESESLYKLRVESRSLGIRERVNKLKAEL